MNSDVDLENLVQSLGHWVRDHALPALTGAEQFNARVAANALDLVARELKRRPQIEAREADRLSALLDMTGDLKTMRGELESRIRSGILTADMPNLMHHLRETTLDRLSIDQPTYSAYRRARPEQASR